jgi:uncharacterized protein (PEP-CTERM system associated)
MNRLRGHAAAIPSDRHLLAAAVALVVGLAPAAVLAQDGPAGRGLSFTAYVDSGADFLVNSRLGGRDAGDLTLELRPGFVLSGRSSRLYGSISYGVGLLQRTRRGGGGSDGDVTHNLAAQFSAEAIDRWMYIDGTAAVARQTINPYGLQGVGNSTTAEANTTEVGTASLSPYVRGTVGSSTSYEVRLNAAATNARRSSLGDQVTWGGTANLSSNLSGRALGWGLQASSQETDYRAGRNTRNDRWSASLYWLPDPDLNLTLRGGEETTDVGAFERERYSNWGGGITWRPSNRTRLQIDGDERYFGTSYRLALEHRMSQMTVQLSSSRSDNGGQSTRVPITAFQLRDAQLASTIPDSSLRQQQVFSDLALLGLSPDDVLFSGLVNSAVSITERHDAVASYAGRRISFSVQLFLEKSRVADNPFGNAPEPVERKGYTANAGYRLGADSSISLAASWLTTLPSATLPGNNLKSLTASFERQLARRTRASFGARYTVFNSSTDPYREAAITARLNHRF